MRSLSLSRDLSPLQPMDPGHMLRRRLEWLLHRLPAPGPKTHLKSTVEKLGE